MGTATASVVVPIFNGVRYLPAFFESLNGALPPNAELVLIDDASSEPVWETVPDFPAASRVHRIQNDSNVGYAAAVNRGFEASSGDYVIQLNTDLILEPNAITAMIDLIHREREVGIVGSKLIFPSSDLVEHVGMAFGELTKHRIFAKLPSGHPLTNRTRELQIVSGATVAMSRRVLNRLGPLDERYYNRNEDIEHCLLARRAGLRNFMCAESVAYHWKSASGPARFARIPASAALFWSRWASSYDIDLPRFVDEGLDYLLQQAPNLADHSFQVLDLTRDVDSSLVLDHLRSRLRVDDVQDFRQTNSTADQLALPLLLPHWTVQQPVPFLYVVDSYRELKENSYWFRRRGQITPDDVVVDLNGVALRSDELTTM